MEDNPTNDAVTDNNTAFGPTVLRDNRDCAGNNIGLGAPNFCMPVEIYESTRIGDMTDKCIHLLRKIWEK